MNILRPLSSMSFKYNSAGISFSISMKDISIMTMKYLKTIWMTTLPIYRALTLIPFIIRFSNNIITDRRFHVTL